MYKNPYQIFGIDDSISAYELRKILLEYKAMAMGLNMLYAAYFKPIGPISAHIENQSEIVEQILSKRYEFGLDFNQIPLTEYEIGDFLRRVTQFRKGTSKNDGQLSTISSEDVKKRVEMYTVSSFFTREMQSRIEKAIEVFDKDSNDPKDDSKMMDMLIELRYGEFKIGIARELAKRISENGLFVSEQEFKNLMMNSTSYEHLKKIYEQIATKDKRDELVPELYVMKNMSDMSGVMIISDDTVKHLLDKENKYASEYFADLSARLGSSKYRNSVPALENQNHDYAWGIVLQEPKTMLDNEIVDTPIFKGRIKVEKLGSFTEKSLFSKSKYARETDIVSRKKAKSAKKRGILSRLRMKRGDGDDSNSPQTMKEQFYLHEAKKTMVDNIWRVTKTELDGKTATYIIFTPLEYLGSRGSELLEFVKNIYLSDYMLGIAMQNGGYAGRIHKDDGGFSISTRYNQEEIASAVLFRNGQRGDILDCRDRRSKAKHSNKTEQDFMDLINPRKRGERIRNE